MTPSARRATYSIKVTNSGRYYLSVQHSSGGTGGYAVLAANMTRMVIDALPGDQQIHLGFKTPLENYIGRILTLLSALSIVGLMWGRPPGLPFGPRKPS